MCRFAYCFLLWIHAVSFHPPSSCFHGFTSHANILNVLLLHWDMQMFYCFPTRLLTWNKLRGFDCFPEWMWRFNCKEMSTCLKSTLNTVDMKKLLPRTLLHIVSPPSLAAVWSRLPGGHGKASVLLWPCLHGCGPLRQGVESVEGGYKMQM